MKINFALELYKLLEIENEKSERINPKDLIITIDMREYYRSRHFIQSNYIGYYISMFIEKIKEQTGSNISEEEINRIKKQIVRKIFFDILTSSDSWHNKIRVFYDTEKDEIKIPIIPSEDSETKTDQSIIEDIENINENYLEYIEDLYEKLNRINLNPLVKDAEHFQRVNLFIDNYLNILERKQTK